MADDKYYIPGSWYFLDDNSGVKVRSGKARLMWNGRMTSGTHWNPRQPQDMVQGVRDEQAPPWTRTRQVNQFTSVASYVTAPSARGSTSVAIQSALGMSVGDLCQMPLDGSGNLFQFRISAISGNTISWTTPGLPGTVGGNFGDPLENQVFDITASQQAAGVQYDLINPSGQVMVDPFGSPVLVLQ
jgi:hypothetical protein